MRQMNALGVSAQDLRPDLHPVALQQFGAVMDVRLGGERAVLGAPAIGFAEAQHGP